MSIKKCLVLGCKNYSDAGTFVGDLCSPCYDMLTTGRVHKNNITFIGEMNKKINLLEEVANSAQKVADIITSMENKLDKTKSMK